MSFSAFWVTLAALGGTVLTAWGGYGKNSEAGLSLKRVGPSPAVKVCTTAHDSSSLLVIRYVVVRNVCTSTYFLHTE